MAVYKPAGDVISRGVGLMDLEELQETVIKLLQTEYDVDVDEAEDLVRESVGSRPELWHENSDPSDLAKFLASDDEDD